MGGIFRQYAWALHLPAILLSSFFLAKIVGVVIAGRLEVKRSIGLVSTIAPVSRLNRASGDLQEYAVITERNIFDSVERATATPEEAETGNVGPITGEAVKTSLGITVLGVLVVGDGRDQRSSATISSGGSKGGEMDVYAVGDVESFAPNTRLTRVAPDRIEFLNGSRLEYAEVGVSSGESIFAPPKQGETVAALPGKAGGESTAVKMEQPGNFVIDQSEVDNALQNLDQLYTEIRAVPNFSGGKVSGMKILSVKGGSLFARLGLKRGDILQRINGMELDVKQGFAIFNQLKDAKNLTVDLVRGGQPQTVEYEIR